MARLPGGKEGRQDLALWHPEKHPCARCGIDTAAEFCKDCPQVDPLTCGTRHERRGARELRVERMRKAYPGAAISTYCERWRPPASAAPPLDVDVKDRF